MNTAGKHDPPQNTYMCINPNCRERCHVDGLGEINYEDDAVWTRLQQWRGAEPDHGCKRCGWPVLKLKTVIKSLAVGAAMGAEGADRASLGVTPEWQAAALSVILEVSHKLARFTSDDLYPQLFEVEHLNNGKPVNYSALGNVMKTAGKLEYITRLPEMIDGARGVQHLKPVRVWRSLAFDEVVCPTCAIVMKSGWKYCPICGKRMDQ